MDGGLHDRIASVSEYLKLWLPLASCHTVEFYAQDLWTKLMPAEIRAEVEEKTLEEAVDMFWTHVTSNEPPSSHTGRFVREALSHHLSVDGQCCIGKKSALEDFAERSLGATSVDKFVSLKKGHEVGELMEVVASLGGTHFVELGGGKGYLGEALARCHKLPSLTVDCNDVALNGGEKRIAKIKKVLPKSSRSDLNLHRFVNTYVREDTSLVDIVQENFPGSLDLDERRVVITGLHTCGDLGAASLRIFAREGAHAVCNVPCCYHLLTEATERDAAALSGTAPGFPMSSAIDLRLGRNARMLASQSIEKVAAARTLPSVGLHYRAVLQDILKKHIPGFDIPEGRLKGVAAKSRNFEEYFRKSVKKLNLNIGTEIDFEEVEEKYSWRRKSLVIFYLLRLCLAQVVECCILLDRLLFLRERCGNAVLVKLFDASRSPRCHAILARR